MITRSILRLKNILGRQKTPKITSFSSFNFDTSVTNSEVTFNLGQHLTSSASSSDDLLSHTAWLFQGVLQSGIV